jgi:hypothetical protein
MMQQNSQLAPNHFIVPIPNIDKNTISPSNATLPNQNMISINKVTPAANITNTGNNLLPNQFPTSYQNSIGQYPQSYSSYMDTMKAYQNYIQQNSYIYTQNNQ